MGYNTCLPKSRLDMYITASRQLSLSATSPSLSPSLSTHHQLPPSTHRALTALSVLWCVRESWPAAEGYWNLTSTFRGFLAAELWRNFPSERTYRALPPAYRPTRAQLTVPHSPMIDWLPWPDVRDAAIRWQGEIDLDALFRVAIHNVVAHRKRRGRGGGLVVDKGRLEAVGRSGLGSASDGGGDDENTSFRIWDLICLEKANGTDPLAEPSLIQRPLPRSPGVKAVLKAYDLEYDDFDTQKLDDGFWEAFPALYAETAASGWRVKDVEGVGRVDVGRPMELRGDMVGRLKEKMERLVGRPISI